MNGTNKRETWVGRIRKLFALAGNNPSESEAQAAMLKAQALLAEHGLSTAEVEAPEPEHVSDDGLVDTGKTALEPWAYKVAGIICRNMRCKTLISYRPGGGTWRRRTYKKSFRIIGMARDADTAAETLRFALRVIPALWRKYWSTRNYWYNSPAATRQARESYMAGFCAGLREQYRAQVETKAIALVVPHAVIERTDKLATGSTLYLRSMSSGDSHAQAAGYQDGRNFGRPHYHVTAGGGV